MDTKPDMETGALWARLLRTKSLDNFLRSCETDMCLPDFACYIRELCLLRGEVPERVIRRAGVERSFGHSLFRGARRPSRDTVLQLAFGFEADVALAQTLLKHARFSLLYPRVKRDAVLAHCLHNGCTVVEAQTLLSEMRLPLLGEG